MSEGKRKEEKSFFLSFMDNERHDLMASIHRHLSMESDLFVCFQSRRAFRTGDRPEWKHETDPN